MQCSILYTQNQMEPNFTIHHGCYNVCAIERGMSHICDTQLLEGQHLVIFTISHEGGCHKYVTLNFNYKKTDVTQVCVTTVIKKYGSTSYLRIAQVLKWPPIHKVQEQVQEKLSRGAQKALDWTTSLLYSNAALTPKVPLTFNKFEKNQT